MNRQALAVSKISLKTSKGVSKDFVWVSNPSRLFRWFPGLFILIGGF